MSRSHFQQVETIFYSALECEGAKLTDYLAAACNSDELLRREVEELLDSYQKANNFIETPPGALAAGVVEQEAAQSWLGRALGHYKIIERLGRGGMSEVYLAIDTKAQRKAALKLLPTQFTGDSTRLNRFRQEARAVVALNHPNIVTAYEIGEEDNTSYIASELIEGETLRQRLQRGRLELREALHIAIQVASALSAAHKAGIVHRDIKPENIMLRHDGYVKVLDFGVAKLAQNDLETSQPHEHSMPTTQTTFGSMMGTLRYMSPEQVRGETVDQRTDIWSFGVVLYEMVAGVAPFSGRTPEEIIQSIQQATPAPPIGLKRLAPPELQQIISKALQKNRERRFVDINEMLESLKQLRHQLELPRQSSGDNWLTNPKRAMALATLILIAASIVAFTFMHSSARRTVASAPKSIAVLPLDNRGAPASDRYLADGIQHELISQLSRIEDFKVISQGSTQRYQHNKRDLVEIAQRLGVTYLLEGSVEKTTDEIRVKMQLTGAPAQAQVWTATYNRPLSDIFSVEREITTRVAGTLDIKVRDDDAQAFASTPTHSNEAHELYLRGHYLAEKRDEQDVRNAIDFYEQAIEKDPTYALAYAGLAEAYILLPTWGTETPIQHCYAIAKTAAQKSVALDPTLPEAHIA